MGNFVNKNLLYLFIISVAVFIIMQQCNMNKRLQIENNRLAKNYNILLHNNKMSSSQLTLTNREFSEMYSSVLLRLKELEIKNKQVQNYINFSYKIKDTVIKVLVKDTLLNNYNFTINDSCYTLKGTIYNDTIKTILDMNDDIDVVLYKKRNTHISWWKRLWNKNLRHITDAVVLSKCLNDTITVKKNIFISDGR